MNLQKPAKPIRDRKHVAFVASLPCCITGRTDGVQAHHLLRTPEKAMGRRSGDNWAVPLCHEEHAILHAWGNEPAFFSVHSIDGPALAKALYAVSGDIEQGRRVLAEMERTE